MVGQGRGDLRNPRPDAAGQPPAEPSAPPADVEPQGEPGEADLAETGGGSSTPYLMGAAAALLAAGGGAVGLARRRG